jgi:uncharacterized damage-inducible protein DinB
MPKPTSGDYQAAYLKYYIDLVQGEDIVKALEAQLSSSSKFLRLLSEEQGNFAYAEGKWSLKEVLGHIIDTERIMAYRALSFSRGEAANLPGYEQDDYVKAAAFNRRSLADLVNEFRLVREGNILLFKSFGEETLTRTGTANNNFINVNTILHFIAGHEIHHMNVIRTKYLN